MNEMFFPVEWSLLSASALAQQVLDRYMLPTAPICHFWSRSINDTYLIRAGETTFFLRVSPAGWRSYEHLSAEIELLHFLRRHSFSIPEPIRQKDGAYIQTLHAPEGLRYAVVFSLAPGSSPAPITEEYSYRYGQAIAQLHTLTNTYPQDGAHHRFGLEDMLDEPLARLKPLFIEHQDDFVYLSALSNRLKQTVSTLPQTAPYYGICHGDVHSGNIHFDPQQAWTLIDFEYAGYGWRVMDISNFILVQVNQFGTKAETSAIRAAFLDGYQSVRRLSEMELAVIPAFVLVRQMWLLGITARLSPNLGLEIVQRWIFDYCLPFMRAWMKEPW
jgi:Ser/Thr protein kinase RdoA (MazF antagonist)